MNVNSVHTPNQDIWAGGNARSESESERAREKKGRRIRRRVE